MMIAHIVAAAQNGTIGVDGDLPWDLPKDMQFFKDQTKNHIIIMGRKTFESIGRPLPKRLNIIITRQENYKIEGAHVFQNIEDALEFAKNQSSHWGDEVYIIGGAEIYRQTTQVIDTIFLTRIHKDFSGHAKYESVDASNFNEIARTDENDNGVEFSFLTFKKS